MNYSTFLCALLLLTTGCVSTKKFQALELERDRYQADAEQLTDLRNQLSDRQQDLQATREELKSTYGELEIVTSKANRLEADYQEMSERYNTLLQQRNDVLNSSAYEKANLEQQLAITQREMDEQRRQLNDLSGNLNLQQQDLVALQSSLATREARVAELEKLLSDKDAQMQSLRAGISSALRNFTAADLTVTEQNGNIYVSLSQNLLFKSGSDRIDSNGRSAIRQLAEVLRASGDIGILVEGYTDTDGTESTNWDLSTSRAVSVARILIDGGVPPQRVTAAGRAFYLPVAPNDTAENKARNRRVEVILSPNLQSLYEIVKE